MHNAYIYPVTKHSGNTARNPYIGNFIQSLSSAFSFENKADYTSFGILNLLKYHQDIDYIFLNWIENIPDRRFGLLQTAFFLSYIYCFKGKRKMVWVLHNKISHDKQHLFLKKQIFRILFRKSDFIITHAREGIEFAASYGRTSSIVYLPHPVTPKDIVVREKKFDILIWGSIIPYKGIDKFLTFLKDNNLLLKYKIKIIGLSSSPEYFRSLKAFENEAIQIENIFLEEYDLSILTAEARCVLFTYSESSVLSSGALMDTIAYHANIVGPDTGAFRDMSEDGHLITYRDFPDLINKLEFVISHSYNILKQETKSLDDLSWGYFAKQLITMFSPDNL